MRSSLALLPALLLAAAQASAQAPAGRPLPPPDAPPAGASDPDVAAGGPARTRAAPGAPGEDAPAPLPMAGAVVLDEVVGTVRTVDRRAHEAVVDTASGPVTLGMDRNTLVYGPNGLVTVLEVEPGRRIRAARNAESVAYWVQLRVEAGSPTSTPGQGTGPAGAGPGPIEPGVPGGGAPTTVGPGSLGPGGPGGGL